MGSEASGEVYSGVNKSPGARELICKSPRFERIRCPTILHPRNFHPLFTPCRIRERRLYRDRTWWISDDWHQSDEIINFSWTPDTEFPCGGYDTRTNTNIPKTNKLPLRDLFFQVRMFYSWKTRVSSNGFEINNPSDKLYKWKGARNERNECWKRDNA